MLYEVSVFTSYYGQSCLNRFNYLSTGTPAAVTGSFALISAMGGIPETLTPGDFPGGTLMSQWQATVSNQVSFTAMSAKAIYDVNDFYELPYVPAPVGDQTGEALSPVMGFGMRTSRVRQDIRRGTKRFEGVPEAHVGGGGVLVSPGTTNIGTLATLMSGALSYDDEGNTLTFTPCVVSKQKYTVTESGREAYRYYPTEADQDDHIASGILWQPYPQVRSQTSRQYGRGQ